MNYNTDAAEWATFADRNYTDRQRINRKAQRWAHNYEGLPPSERLSVLAALIGVHRHRYQ